MHSTGSFIEDRRTFSEVNWGHRTVVYAKLANDMNTVQWNSFYKGLAYTDQFHEKLKEFGRPAEHWTDDPNEYFVVGSDPVDGEAVVEDKERDEEPGEGSS